MKDTRKGYDLTTISSSRPRRNAKEDVTPTFILDGGHPYPGEKDRPVPESLLAHRGIRMERYVELEDESALAAVELLRRAGDYLWYLRTEHHVGTFNRRRALDRDPAGPVFVLEDEGARLSFGRRRRLGNDARRRRAALGPAAGGQKEQQEQPSVHAPI